MQRPRLLFVCSRNQWRSPTATEIYKDDPRIEVKSAGLSPRSPRRLSVKDIGWADVIVVMEKSHRSRILAEYREHPLPQIEVLDIPDDYQFMDEELIEMITGATEFLIQNLSRIG